MTSRIEELAMRRRALVLRSARLRGEFAEDFRAAAASVKGVDQAVAIARRVSSRPLLVAGAVALVLVVRPLRAIRWAGRALVFVSVAKRVLSVVSVLRARAAAPAQ